MGMHLNYELRLPAQTTPDVVTDVLRELQRFARTQPFAQVSPLVAATDLDEASASWRETLQLFARGIATPYDEDVPPLTGDPDSATGFLVNAGRGCETAAFGLLRRRDPSGAAAEWFWHCCCKTQYASVVSDAHFIMCHTSLTAVLDHAIHQGLDVVVRDEGHYWETRDTARLLSEVAYMNRLVARFAGAFSDAISQHPIANEVIVHAPILDHPRFEHLEMGEQDTSP